MAGGSDVKSDWLRQLREAGLAPRVVPGPRRLRKSCWCFRLRVNIEGIGIVKITVCLPWRYPRSPRIYVEGPRGCSMDSPHRYADGALCMWFPRDGASRTWQPDKGPVVLVGHIIRHLAQEEWWRRTGDWPGEEAPHNPEGARS